MKLLINYANKAFVKSQKKNSKTAINFGLFDKVISYSPKHIDVDFYKKNIKILKHERGNGYWLWKPYFIKKSLALLQEGDFLFYCDSGAYFIAPITPLIDIVLKTGQDIIPFELSHLEKCWTKRDAFILMDCDKPEYTESKQRLAGFNLWRKSKLATEFSEEFLSYSQDIRLITDQDNKMGRPNYSGFNEHRHDQSIFSLLTKKYRLEAFRNPAQWGNDKKEAYTNSTYGQIIVHTHMRRDPLIKKAIRKFYRRKIKFNH